MKNTLLYFDNNATTAIDERVLQVMLPHFRDFYGNASSLHAHGQQAEKVVKHSRKQIAQFIDTEEEEIYFTSGATESINLALKGLALAPGNRKRHIITCRTEHKAVLDSCAYLESVGFYVEYLPVDNSGKIDLQLLERSINSDTLLICIMWVNNETGVIHPISEIGKIARKHDVYFVCDTTQGIGKLPFSLKETYIDVICFSGHKFYGPKGIGVIAINKAITRSNLIAPLIHGGGHEKGLRSGTYNVPLIVGLAEACAIAATEMTENAEKINILRIYIENMLLEIGGSVIHGIAAPRIYNTINASIPGFDTSIFLGINRNIAVSNGSACSSSLIQPSHVLHAMNIDNKSAMNSIRISIGKDNTMQEAEILLTYIKNFQ